MIKENDKIVPPISRPLSSSRTLHRLLCALSGILAIFGGMLAYVIHPGFVIFALVGGLGLVLSPELKG
ncbi:MAG: hypothetical protein U0798_09900 [Gemmataceae bacterium]